MLIVGRPILSFPAITAFPAFAMGAAGVDRAAPFSAHDYIRTPEGRRVLFWRFLGGFVGGASTLTFARVLALAAIVASLASALAFTRILTFAGVLALVGVSQSTDRGSGLALDTGCVRLYCQRPAQQTGNSSAGDHRF